MDAGPNEAAPGFDPPGGHHTTAQHRRDNSDQPY